MSFLQDYCYYSSGNETPEEYLYWGGLSILGHILGHKVCIVHGDYFAYRPQLYICLVGEAGAGKNTALAVNMDIMVDHFPRLLLSASIQSREDIAHQMADDTTCLTTWNPQDGGPIQDYRPFYILNNELASFLSVDKMKMVEFLTEIYDGKRFSTGFKKDRIDNPTRKQWFRNPHVSLLAGAVPSWFMTSLKLDLFSGGLGRRLIIVNGVRDKVIPFPKKPVGADAALQRVVAHLKEAEKFQGAVKLGADASRWWEAWYIAHRKERPSDPIIYQFHQTKSMQLMKVALLLRCTELPLGHEVSADHLEGAKLLLDNLMPSIQRLTSGIGRNELAGVGSQIIDFIERTGGMASEVQIKKFFHRYAKTPEFIELENHYITTGEIIVLSHSPDGVLRKYYFTPEGYAKYQKMQADVKK